MKFHLFEPILNEILKDKFRMFVIPAEAGIQTQYHQLLFYDKSIANKFRSNVFWYFNCYNDILKTEDISPRFLLPQE